MTDSRPIIVQDPAGAMLFVTDRDEIALAGAALAYELAGAGGDQAVLDAVMSKHHTHHGPDAFGLVMYSALYVIAGQILPPNGPGLEELLDRAIARIEKKGDDDA